MGYESVRRAFNRSVSTYDYNCMLQLTTARHLIELIKRYGLRFGTGIDLGCGTGVSTEILKKDIDFDNFFLLDVAEELLGVASDRFGDSNVRHSSFDAVPFEDNQFNVVFSNMSFQWSNDLEKTIAESGRILKKEGLLAFSLPSNESFQQLRERLAVVGVSDFFNDFVFPEEVLNVLKDYRVLDFQTKFYTFNFSSLYALLRSIKNAGASCVTNQSHAPMRRSDIERLDAHLRQCYPDNNIPLEYAITYCVAKKDVM